MRVAVIYYASDSEPESVSYPAFGSCLPLSPDSFLFRKLTVTVELAGVTFTHMKQNLYSLCSQPGGNSWRLGSISHTGTSMILFCP